MTSGEHSVILSHNTTDVELCGIVELLVRPQGACKMVREYIQGQSRPIQDVFLAIMDIDRIKRSFADRVRVKSRRAKRDLYIKRVRALNSRLRRLATIDILLQIEQLDFMDLCRTVNEQASFCYKDKDLKRMRKLWLYCLRMAHRVRREMNLTLIKRKASGVARDVAFLDPLYVRGLLSRQTGMTAREIPWELVQAKQWHLAFKRLLTTSKEVVR